MDHNTKMSPKQWSKLLRKEELERKKRNKRKGDDSLSEQDLRGLMGTSRPTYQRKRGGAFRQR